MCSCRNKKKNTSTKKKLPNPTPNNPNQVRKVKINKAKQELLKKLQLKQKANQLTK